MYTASFVTSFPMKYLNNKAGRKLSFLIGTSLGFCACAWVYFGGDEDGKADEFFKHSGIFFAAAMFGSAGSAVLITSLSLTAELIGNNTETSAFVYGAMSFTDKVSNGLAVMVIQHFIPWLVTQYSVSLDIIEYNFYVLVSSVVQPASGTSEMSCFSLSEAPQCGIADITSPGDLI